MKGFKTYSTSNPLQTADGVSANYDTITSMLESLGDLVDRLNIYVNEKISVSMKKMIIENLTQVLVILGLGTKAIKGKRTSMSDLISSEL